MIREFRASDAPALVGLLTTQFPEEEALLGTAPETFFEVVRRVQRWPLRLLLGLLRLARRPVYRLLVVEEDGRLVGTTLLTFPTRAVYLSMVVVDPASRRRGHARALLAEAARVAGQLHRSYLVLDVLANNVPARTLYEQRLGYRPLRASAFFVHEHPPADFGPAGAGLPPGVRRFRPSDDPALAAIARRQTPADVQRVLPTSDHPLAGSRTTNRIFDSESAAWVVDRGRGAEALLSVTYGPGREAAQLSDPIVAADTDPALVRELVRTAVAWCGARRAVRVLALVPRYNTPGHEALAAEGFREALATRTLYRTVG